MPIHAGALEPQAKTQMNPVRSECFGFGLPPSQRVASIEEVMDEHGNEQVTDAGSSTRGEDAPWVLSESYVQVSISLL